MQANVGLLGPNPSLKTPVCEKPFCQPIPHIMSSGEGAVASNDTGFAGCLQQCCSGIWSKIKEGRRKTQARWLCAISVLGCSFVAITSVTSGCVPTILIAMFVISRSSFPTSLSPSFPLSQLHVVYHRARRASVLFGMDSGSQNLVGNCCSLSRAILGTCFGVHRVCLHNFLHCKRSHVFAAQG